MSEEDNETTKGKMIPITGEISFLQDEKDHPLYKTMKALDKEVRDVIRILSEIANDADADKKLRHDACKTLLDKRLQVGDMISKENLSRLIYQAKMSQDSKRQIKGVMNADDDDEEGSSGPAYVPDVIQDISKIKNL